METHLYNPKTYSFDLADRGALQMPKQSVFCLNGFSDKALETVKLLDDGANALMRRIEAIEL